MSTRPLYENLDTAFVNLSALVKYLRQREFVGRIRLELNNYEGDIILYEGNKLNAREHDKISGRTFEGEEAFQILLIRGREPGGTVHVYQETKTAQSLPKPAEGAKAVEPKKVVTPKVEAPEAKKTINVLPTLIVTNGKSAPASKPVEAAQAAAASSSSQNSPAPKVVKIADVPKKTEPAVNLPKFPFDLHNKVEEKARRNQLSSQDWQMLLDLTGELLATIDKSLAEAKLDFKSAFAKSRSEISADYPFLFPSGRIFEYEAGKVSMSEQVNAKLFVTGIIESLRRILEKLGANPKFTEVYRRTAQRILALINQRQTFYDKFAMTKQLKKIVGV
jgi:hypothetical protein